MNFHLRSPPGRTFFAWVHVPRSPLADERETGGLDRDGVKLHVITAKAAEWEGEGGHEMRRYFPREFRARNGIILQGARARELPLQRGAAPYPVGYFRGLTGLREHPPPCPAPPHLLTKVIRAGIVNWLLRGDRVRLAAVVTGDNWPSANREDNDERVSIRGGRSFFRRKMEFIGAAPRRRAR